MASKVRITWVKSAIGSPKRHKATVASLGLRRLNQSVVHQDNPTIRGMAFRVRHLVSLQELPAEGGESKE